MGEIGSRALLKITTSYPGLFPSAVGRHGLFRRCFNYSRAALYNNIALILFKYYDIPSVNNV